MPGLPEAQKRHSLFYGSLVETISSDFDRLDCEFAQIQFALTWLTDQAGSKQARTLLDFVANLPPYLQGRGLNADLLTYSEKGLEVAAQTGGSTGWLYLLKYEAFWALGEWEEALAAAQSALAATEGSESKTYARAVLALGRLQLNRGQYREALRTLAKAQVLLTDVCDDDGVAAAKAEVAAYYLNRNEHAKALGLYLEVDRLRRQAHPASPSNHTLLMLGVVHRRLKNYEKAAQFLTELIQRGVSQKDRGAVATGKHHLAWVYYEQARWDEAKSLGLEAKGIYEELKDPRGSSDADEQLGSISLAQRDFRAAETYLLGSLAVRNQLGNQHGAASSLRRLAKLRFAQKQARSGLDLFWQSLTLFQRLGMLSRQRFFNMVGDLFG